jgi:ketosteroid isomerase-like protein
MSQTSVDDWLAFLHPQAEYQPFPDEPIYRGLTEIRRWAEKAASNADRPQPSVVSVSETADRAVVRAQLGLTRETGETRYLAWEPAAWVVTVADGKLRRVEAFSDWAHAERAAGFTADDRVREHRWGSGPLMMLRRLLCVLSRPRFAGRAARAC